MAAYRPVTREKPYRKYLVPALASGTEIGGGFSGIPLDLAPTAGWLPVARERLSARNHQIRRWPDACSRFPDYLMFRELLKQAETDAALKEALRDLIRRFAPMAEFRELRKRSVQQIQRKANRPPGGVQ